VQRGEQGPFVFFRTRPPELCDLGSFWYCTVAKKDLNNEIQTQLLSQRKPQVGSLPIGFEIEFNPFL
jgi:hypothetical protein